MDSLSVALTIDVDPDNYDPSIFGAQDGWSFHGLDGLLDGPVRRLHELEDSLRRRPRLTWFLRHDPGIKEGFGDFRYVFDHYRNHWDSFLAQGDEIAWHPHVRSVGQLEEAYEALGPLRGSMNISSVRIGEAYGSNEFMARLDGWGFTADSSALPGRVRHDELRDFDWSTTPQAPYLPSLRDYRIAGLPARRILEVPMTMIPTCADYDRTTLPRYLNLSFHSHQVEGPLRELVVKADLLVAILHPCEILPARKAHPLLSFSLDTVLHNLRFLLAESTQARRPLSFVTVKEAVALVRKGMIRHGA